MINNDGALSLEETRHLIKEALRTGETPDPVALEAAALGLAGSHESSEARCDAIVQAARFFYVSGKPPVSLRIADQAKRFADETGQTNRVIDAISLMGICSADMDDLPSAMQRYAEGLDLAQQSNNLFQEAKLWQNTGAALVYGGLYREATACFYKTLALAEIEPMAAVWVGIAYSNIAQCALNLDEVERGLAAIKIALARLAPPTDAVSVHDRVLAHKNYARLLITAHDVDGVMQQARLAREVANLSKSSRSDMQASVAEGLAEALSVDSGAGIARLEATLARATQALLPTRELLGILVKALEHAGRHDEALKYLKDMLAAQRKTSETNVLHHVRQHLLKLHANDVSSPIEDLGQAMRRVEVQLEVVEGRVAKAEVLKQRQELFAARVETMERLAVAAELRDDSTGQHSYRVGRLACLLAAEADCDDETILMIDIAARLHDIGKIGIPDHVLLKPRAFNTSERYIMETHSEMGADLLAKSEIPHIKMAEEIARHHHERWDGFGYPAKIGGREIPMAARVTALADVFDALTHVRPYKPAWPIESALLEIRAGRGTHFDPALTDLFLALVARLQREHTSLDFYLGEAARASTFLQARGKIWDTLALAKDEYQRPT